MLDPALFATMTWLDWVIVGIPAAFALIGLAVGGTSLMLFGLIRFLTAVPIALAPVYFVTMQQKPLLQKLAVQFNATFAMASLAVGVAVFVVALIVAYILLGFLWAGLRDILSLSFIGRALDRLVGIPLGLFVGTLLCAILVIPPSVQFRSTWPQSDQPPGLRESVVLPMVEQQIRELMRYVPAPGG